MSRFSRLRALIVVAASLVVFGTPAGISIGAAQDVAVPGLGGTTLVASTSSGSGGCWTDAPSSFSFLASGAATGAYPGTFVESGTVTIDGAINSTQRMTAFSSTFTIDSPNGQVSGTKWLEPFSSSQNMDTGDCEPLSSGDYRYVATAWNLRYEATITTPDGRTCTTVGSSILQFVHNSSVLPNQFTETYYNDLDPTTPSCTGGGGNEEPPSEGPVTKDDCKDGGWEAYGFPNQGQCIQFVNGGE